LKRACVLRRGLARQVLRVLWSALMKSINLTGKNQQQISQSLVAKFKTYGKLFGAFATNGKAELALINVIQVRPRGRPAGVRPVAVASAACCDKRVRDTGGARRQRGLALTRRSVAQRCGCFGC
jgi:hypothetical protein